MSVSIAGTDKFQREILSGYHCVNNYFNNVCSVTCYKAKCVCDVHGVKATCPREARLISLTLSFSHIIGSLPLDFLNQLFDA